MELETLVDCFCDFAEQVIVDARGDYEDGEVVEGKAIECLGKGHRGG